MNTAAIFLDSSAKFWWQTKVKNAEREVQFDPKVRTTLPSFLPELEVHLPCFTAT